jgi:hypothetical protein
MSKYFQSENQIFPCFWKSRSQAYENCSICNLFWIVDVGKNLNFRLPFKKKENPKNNIYSIFLVSTSMISIEHNFHINFIYSGKFFEGKNSHVKFMENLK